MAFCKERKIFSVRLPYSFAMEDYANGKLKLVTVWSNREIQSLFSYKDKVQHHSYIKYCGVCFRGADYVGLTIINSEIRWKRNSNGRDKNSNCVKHSNDNFNHEFQWFVLTCSSNVCLKRKILGAYCIKTRQPSWNSQENSDVMSLYRNRVT